MAARATIDDFLTQDHPAVIGASRNSVHRILRVERRLTGQLPR